ncbi:class I SAM-dependent methyltransferase [Salinibacter ruber]|uniref:class I SAM-dependent methyltransferase n=1 Tax=Salinibacter ruber TaxID=146919 RepID=UPI002167E393|nr:class I SAM-dependent methyltransferase [Salinibacter ruber]MCS3697038.1 SAM-dependent methyltransferase [Salinibacter ruber]
MRFKIDKIKSTLIRWKNFVAPDPEQFDTEALERRSEFKKDYRVVANSLRDNLDFDTVLDVGCAQGFLMEYLHESCEVWGVEVSEDVIEYLPNPLKPRVEIADFQEAEGNYDLVCCVEVAEHIEPARSEQLVEKICDLSTQYVYFTAAPPGQVGHGHINCRPHRHWVEWFKKQGWIVNESLTKTMRQDLDKVKNAYWLQKNSFLLVKRQRKVE